MIYCRTTCPFRSGKRQGSPIENSKLLAGIAETTLNNGLKVICLRKPGAPIAAVQVWYKVGSAFEQSGIRGISHFLEHMMFRGSARIAPEEHAHRINDEGGHCNAFTAEDVTAFTNSVPADLLDLVLDLEADRMDGLQLNPKLFEIERSVIIEEYHTYMNNPVAKAFLEFRQAFYGDHPYALSPLGLIDDIATVTSETCREYYARYYAPDNAVLVIVGDILEKEVFELAAKHFGPKRGRAGLRPVIKEHALQAAARMKRLVEFDVPILVAGFPAPPSSHIDATALEILMLAAAGGETSRLHREVVRRQSLAVMAGGMNHFMQSSGMSMFFAAFTPNIRSERVERAIDHEIARIIDGGISQEEMEKVRNTTLTNRTFDLYSADNICYRLGYGEAVDGDYRSWVDRLDALENLDCDRLIATARRWWNDGSKHVLYLKPRRSNPLLFAGGLLRRASSLRLGKKP